MKNRIALLMLVIMVFVPLTKKANAQIPRMFSYQGILTDNAGKLLNGDHSITFNLYSTSAGGLLYTENQTIPVTSGIFSATIGSVVSIPTIVKFDNTYYLGITVDGGAELTPRTAIVAVPYSLNSVNAAHSRVSDSASYASHAHASDSASHASIADIATTATTANTATIANGLNPTADINTSGSLTFTGIPAPALPNPLSHILYLNASNKVQQTAAGINIITGNGTTNAFPLWTGSGNTLGNSILTETGSGTGMTITGINGLNINGATNALQISTGNIIYAFITTLVASGATIPDGVAVVDVGDNNVPASPATVTLPTGIAGQVICITTEDPDGVKISVGLASVTLSNAEAGTFIFINGKWRLQH
jgi:hypothetical protein